MNQKNPTKKELAFALFDKGCGPSDPEVKELKLRGNSRYTYHTQWRNSGGVASSPKLKLSRQSSKPARRGTPLPGGESVSAIDETKLAKKSDVKTQKPTVEVAATSVEEELAEEPVDIEEEPTEEGDDVVEEGTGEVEEPEEKDVRSEPGIRPVNVSAVKRDGKRELPRDITGQGITVTVELAVPTLFLYQIAAAKHEDLTLGDFLDVCVEDTYRVRGMSPGLVKLRSE